MATVRETLREVVERTVRSRLPANVPVTPTYIQVELADRCNLRCVRCPIEELTQARSAKYLNVNEFARIAEQFPALRRVDLQGIGEPLVNPHMEAIVALCRARRLEVGFVTNGMLMKPERAARLLAAGARRAENVDAVIARLREAAARIPRLGVEIAFVNDHTKLRCRWSWTAAYVTAEGAVTPCCNCPDARVKSLGNLLETPFSRIWNGREYRAFRRELRCGVPAICRECPE